jgi:hypothetical protein
MKRYYEGFAQAYGLDRQIRFGTTLTALRPLPSGWQATFSQGPPEAFRSVLVANGHHWDKSLPAWVQDFRGEVLHSKDYKRPAQLAGKRVLVLGGGNSGCDLVSEAARVAREAHWSLRRGYWFLPKTLLGRPTVELMNPWVPVAAQRALITALLRLVVGRYEDYGLPRPDHRLFEAHPTVSTEVFHYLKHGRIQPHGDVARAEGQEVVFTNGERLEVDLVVCATGYRVSVPFLPEGLLEVRGKTPQLVAGLLVPGQRGLFVTAAYQARYGVGPLLRPMAQLVAEWEALDQESEVPLADLLTRLGARPPEHHLADPHQVLRRIRLGRRLTPLLRRMGRRSGPPRPAASPPAAGAAGGPPTDPGPRPIAAPPPAGR